MVYRSFARSLLKQGYYKRIINKFGALDIDKISRLDIKNYLVSLEMKNVSKNVYRSCIKAIFELAVDDEVIEYNPALAIKFKPEPKEIIKYYTKGEVNKLLSVASGVIKPFLQIAFNTGLRIGEILGLQISDFKDGFIHVQRTRTKGVLGIGKTVNANRYVPYPINILDELKELETCNNFIFGNIDDAMYLRTQWASVCKLANVPKYKLYSTRHTYATLMLKENIVSINELAGLLGHSSPKVTLEHYAGIIKPKMLNLSKDFYLYGHDMVIVEDDKLN